MPDDAPDQSPWQHWPPERATEERRRHRLRGLFQPTTADDHVEELIAERGKELEERTRALTETIADLELREERSRKLRVTVEQMLRQGSAELDERQSELAAFAEELAAREARMAETERVLADRRSELGAVELRRAAVERREVAVTEREASLDAIAADLTQKVRTLEEAESELARMREESLAAPSPVEPETPEREHLALIPTERYRFEPRPGAAPEPGSIVEIDERQWRVVRVVPPVLPGDGPRVAVLEPAPL